MMSEFNYKEYMSTHEFKDAQIKALGEAVEECIDENDRLISKLEKAIKRDVHISRLIDEMLDELHDTCDYEIYLYYCDRLEDLNANNFSDD